MAVFCVYAPTQASSEDDSGAAALDFYTMLGKAIDDLPVLYGGNYCICGDFNARVGTSSLEEEDALIRNIRGDYIKSPEVNSNGDSLLELCMDKDVRIAKTEFRRDSHGLKHRRQLVSRVARVAS